MEAFEDNVKQTEEEVSSPLDVQEMEVQEAPVELQQELPVTEHEPIAETELPATEPELFCLKIKNGLWFKKYEPYETCFRKSDAARLNADWARAYKKHLIRKGINCEIVPV